MRAFDRRYALLGWLVWGLAKRRVRKRVHLASESLPRRRLVRSVAVLGLLAAFGIALSKASAARRGGGPPGHTE